MQRLIQDVGLFRHHAPAELLSTQKLGAEKGWSLTFLNVPCVFNFPPTFLVSGTLTVTTTTSFIHLLTCGWRIKRVTAGGINVSEEISWRWRVMVAVGGRRKICVVAQNDLQVCVWSRQEGRSSNMWRRRFSSASAHWPKFLPSYHFFLFFSPLADN